MNDDMLSPQSLSIEPRRRDRITAISSAVQRKPIVLVLGMHRSGTSLCSHLLSALGVDMADDIGADATNARGHWERWEIVEFHDRILGLFNRDYLERFHDFPLPVAWWADPRVVQIKHEIVAFLEKRMGEGYFGFKDPRTMRLMPLWHQIFNELKLAPKLVLCLRNPAQVARSLNTRNGLDPAIGEYRWLVHIVDFFRYISKFDFCTVEYEEWFNNPSANIEKLTKFLDLQWQQSESDLSLVLSGIIDPALRHDDAEHREPNQPLVRSLYKLTSRAGDGGGARDQIGYIVSQFVSFQQLQRPFQQAFEGVAEIAAKYPEIEQETTALRAVVGERDVGIAAAEGRANAAEARLADALTEIEEQRARIADLARERDDANGLRTTLAEREAALAELSRRTDELLAARQSAQAERAGQERATAAAAMQTEVTTLRDAPAQAERQAQDHAVETPARQHEIAALEQAAQERGAVAEAMQVEVAALRDALTQAERQAQDHAAETAARQVEVAALWDTLAQAEDEARRAQEHAMAAAQHEITALRGVVGKAEHEAAERAAEVDPIQVEVVTLQAALAHAEWTPQRRAAAAEALEAEVAALRAKLAQAEGEATERSTAAAAMEAEIFTLRDGLAQAENEARGRAAATAALHGEIAGLREMLAQSERESQERAASAAALQAEVAALQGILTAARQVGRAAIAAFRIDAATPAKPDGSLGWRQSIIRFVWRRHALSNRRVETVQHSDRG
jgi:hypothetical protein